MRTIVGICGKAGAGKDTIANYLEKKHGFLRIALADPMKRFCKEVFQFTDEQLWGPSEKRNAHDTRYGRMGRDTLTPRYALQTLGTEWGRDCYPNVWIDYGIRVATALLTGRYLYTPVRGLWQGDGTIPPGVVFSDIRFRNEVAALGKAGALLVRVKSHLSEAPGIPGHKSETEQDSIPDSDFDTVINNTGSFDDLYATVDKIVASFK